MISSRRKKINPLLLAVASWPAVVKHQPFTRMEIESLVHTYILQTESNKFPSIRDVMARMSVVSRKTTGYHMTALVHEDLLELVPPGGMYNVTVKGEYFIRGIVTSISRIVNESKVSRWDGRSNIRSSFTRKKPKQ
jgi:hypothetical protein